VNRQIASLFRMVAIGFAILITMTAYWQIWAADSLATRQDNARLVYRQLAIKRGLIYASNGKVLARNRAQKRDGQTIYTRVYPYGKLFAHVVGYNTVDQGRSGIELSYNDFLTAANNDLATQLRNLGDAIRGETVTGDNLDTSLSLPAQRAAAQGLAGQHLVGAVVALQPSTFRVLAMASSPSFNPNTVVKNFAKLNRPRSGAPLLNRAMQGLYAPGSTFKTVTATAALDTKKYTPDSQINAFGTCLSPSQFPIFAPLCNAPGESFGTISLSTAMTYSVNTVFAQVGLALGPRTMTDYMTRYGFFTNPPLDFPSDEMSPSGRYQNGRMLRPNSRMDVARVAIGQEKLAVTPFQMAEVAATIGNGGELMQPTLVDRAVQPGGSVDYKATPHVITRVMSAQTAQELAQMMKNVVDEGTGTAANLQGLTTVAGKTGTAETGISGINTAWFIAFAPVVHPQIAVAVTIEHTRQFGGQIAAPIAAQVIKAYLTHGVAQ
jgi:peptidoglycan glycosyltransferase